MFQISKKEGENLIEFTFECEYCTGSWSDDLRDLIDRCTPDELRQIQAYIESKLA